MTKRKPYIERIVMSMQITLEQVKFYSKTGLNYEDAQELMEEAGGDLLRALNILERAARLLFIIRFTICKERGSGNETLLSRLGK